jgi:hypothetical protein
MNSVILSMISALAHLAVGQEAWGTFQAVVKIVDSEELSGAEKMALAREKAIEFLEAAGIKLFKSLVGLGLEMAVTKMKLTADDNA